MGAAGHVVTGKYRKATRNCSHLCSNISAYQICVVLLILHPKLISQWLKHCITLSIRPLAEFYYQFVIVIALGLFHLSTTVQNIFLNYVQYFSVLRSRFDVLSPFNLKQSTRCFKSTQFSVLIALELPEENCLHVPLHLVESFPPGHFWWG